MDVKVPENLWASTMLPEGIVERWFVSDRAIVNAGDPLVEVRIEDALHEITAAIRGRLTISAVKNDVIEPGSVLGQVDPSLGIAA